MWKSSFDIFHECCSCRDKSLHWYWYSLSRQCFKPAVTVTSESDLSWWLITTTTWCQCSPCPRSPGQISPSARPRWADFRTPSLSWGFVSIEFASILRIQLWYSDRRSHKILWQLDLVLAVGWIIQESQQCNARHFFTTEIDTTIFASPCQWNQAQGKIWPGQDSSFASAATLQSAAWVMQWNLQVNGLQYLIS